MPAKIYTEKDADLNVLKGKTVAVIGFGSPGHAHALNLRESGIDVIIGLYQGSKSIAVARILKFKVYDNAQAVKKADVIMFAVPDLKIPAVYEKDVLPHLTS
ncbi:MAG: NAD(P)-binding domain-containing protein, partial [Verrucomicrobiota bacterium]